MAQLARFSYIKWKEVYLKEKPYQVFVPLPPGVPFEKATNLDFEMGNEELVHDIRDAETPCTLNKHGFQLCAIDDLPRLPSTSEEIEKTYLPYVTDLVKSQIKGAERVVVFDWRTRQSKSPVQSEIIDLNDTTIPLTPAYHVHVDQTPVAARKRVELHAPEELYRLDTGRVRIVKYMIDMFERGISNDVSVWRPLCPIVKNWPLALCDKRFVREEDLVAAEHVRRAHIGESYYLRANPGYRWWYLSEQKRNEAFFIQIWDSHESGVSGKNIVEAEIPC